jgi:hypothetical protein
VSRLILAALRRKREAAKRAGSREKVKRIDARIAAMEGTAEQSAVPAPAEESEPEEVEADMPDMTPAALEAANEAGLTAADFEGHEASGMMGYTVADVRKIAGSKNPETGEA